MDRKEFSDLVGGTLRHVTLKTNLPGIRQNGLLRASTLIEAAKEIGGLTCPRSEAYSFNIAGLSVTLNHQKPLLAGRKRVAEFLDGHCLNSWAESLDHRLFFWPGRGGADFSSSLTDRGTVIALRCDAGAFFDLYAASLDFAPINTGSAMRSASKRGDWIYVPATASIDQFRENRRARGLVKGRDGVVEVSLRCDIAAENFQKLFSIED
ncbi:MAG: hypothetical protein AAF583_11100 [Pseudomonadota bacterium]